jgi:uracil-DNA glycosylase family 4
MSLRQRRYLAAIGIPVFEVRREEGAPAAAPAPAQSRDDDVLTIESAALVALPTAVSAGGADVWESLAGQVRVCTRCELHRSRTQTVFGVGRRDAELLVIGEAPGADEDRQGEPFVGRAGQLLNEMLRAIGLPRKDVYIANILKCRPPGNRDPQPEEASACTPYLRQQIGLVRPRAILAVGRIAAQWLLQSDSPIGRLRGRVFPYGEAGTPLIVTYHPAYLLRSPMEKAKAWTDLCMVKDLLLKAQ